MAIAIDIFLILVFLAFIISFTKYGFARTVFKIGRTWLSFFTSIAIGPFISGAIKSWFLSGSITNGIYNTLVDVVENNPNGYSLSTMFENLPSGFISFLEHYHISLPELESIYGSSTDLNLDMIRAIAERIAEPCADMVSSILGHIICFTITFVFFKWINFEIRKRRVPIFRYIDHVLGFFCGFAISCAVVIGFSMLVYTVFQIIIVYDAQSSVMDIYNRSVIFKFLNQYDIIGIIKQMWT